MANQIRNSSRLLAAAIALIWVLVGESGARAADATRVIEVSSAAQLHEAFAEPVEDVIVQLAPGEYRLTPRPFTDPTCGNCQDPEQTAETTVGLHVRGRNVTIRGPRREGVDGRGGDGGAAVIHTGAGYGIYVDGVRGDGGGAVIEHLTITGGARSEDGNATDGAIVVRDSVVTIRNNVIRDNLGDEEVLRQTVSGIMGIVGREGSDMRIIGNEIRRNSWDGIALYREAKAVIEGNVIDGVDAATGREPGGGRGVGIGVTWDAQVEARGNLVRKYWKGIGLFVNAKGIVEENIVEDILTWGISLWDAGGGEPRGVFRRNAVYRIGACGASITSRSTGEDVGEFTGNAIVRAGQDERYDSPDRYCAQCALAVRRAPDAFRIEGNMFFDNRRGSEDLPDHDVPEDEFRTGIAELVRVLAGHEALAGSAFLREFGE